MGVYPSADALSADNFRGGVFSYVSANSVDKLAEIPGLEFKKRDGFYDVKITMPDGSVEYWAQTDAVDDRTAGFTGAAFERRNADGSTYLDANKMPSVFISYPGNDNSEADLDTARRIVFADDQNRNYNLMEHLKEGYFDPRDEFIKKVGEGMVARAALHGHYLGHVTHGGHSIGVNAAVGSDLALRRYFDSLGREDTGQSRTLLQEPVGAAQAMQLQAELLAKSFYGEDVTPQQMASAAHMIVAHTVSVRDADGNELQGDGGDQVLDNAMIGETYLIDVTPGAGRDTSEVGHMASTMLNAILDGEEFKRNESGEHSVEELLNSQKWDQTSPAFMSRRLMADMFFETKGMTGAKEFNAVSAYELHAKADAPRYAFESGEVLVQEQRPSAPAVTAVAADKSALEVLGDYLKEKNLLAADADVQDWSPEMNRAVAVLTTAAQLDDSYRTAFKEIYGREADGPDMMPGPATMRALEARGVPPEVLAAMDGLKLSNRAQRDDLYTIPEDSIAVLAAVRESNPLAPAEDAAPVMVAALVPR